MSRLLIFMDDISNVEIKDIKESVTGKPKVKFCIEKKSGSRGCIFEEYYDSSEIPTMAYDKILAAAETGKRFVELWL